MTTSDQEPDDIETATKGVRHLVDAKPDNIGRVVALSNDLMDRSKLVAAFPDIEIVRLIVPRSLVGAGLFLVDLSVASAVDAIEAASSAGVRTVAYGSHVDTARLLDATQAGAEALPRSVFFRRLSDGTLGQ